VFLGCFLPLIQSGNPERPSFVLNYSSFCGIHPRGSQSYSPPNWRNVGEGTEGKDARKPISPRGS